MTLRIVSMGVTLIVDGLDGADLEGSPFLTITRFCDICGAELTRDTFDVRDATDFAKALSMQVDAAERGDESAEIALAHLAGHGAPR